MVHCLIFLVYRFRIYSHTFLIGAFCFFYFSGKLGFQCIQRVRPFLVRGLQILWPVSCGRAQAFVNQPTIRDIWIYTRPVSRACTSLPTAASSRSIRASSEFSSPSSCTGVSFTGYCWQISLCMIRLSLRPSGKASGRSAADITAYMSRQSRPSS